MTVGSDTPDPTANATPGGGESASEKQVQLEFDDNRLLPALYGEHDRHLVRIEGALGVQLISRGNRLIIAGPSEATAAAGRVLRGLYEQLERGQPVEAGDVDAALRHIAASGPARSAMSANGSFAAEGGGLVISTRKRQIMPRSPNQAAYLRAMRGHDLVFALGAAGTGKTYLAVASAVSALNAGEVDRIILSRPAVEAGERLGFLPGDMREKIDPYLRPLYDALHDMMPAEQVVRRMETGEIEVAPLAFMRGRTLAHSFVILDEAQNTTSIQMKMCLTRLGEGARMVVTGDTSQIDLPAGMRSGLVEAVETLEGVEGIGFVRFTAEDTVRHPLVSRIVRAYERQTQAGGKPQGGRASTGTPPTDNG
jgi:phosphate starvation-inducible PhoH-like protein